MRAASALAALVLLASACGSSTPSLVIGAGTTIVDSGFADALADRYESADVVVVGGSSRELLALLEAGAIDVAITHHPEAEAEYLSEHPGVSSSVVFSSSFVFAADAAVADEHLRSLSINDLLVRIAGSGLTFVARGDGSGTAAAEQRLWSAAGVNPEGEWYLETGQGMGFTLQVVDQLDGITLAELGAVVASVDRLDLVYWSPADLDNPYRATVGDDASDAADEFVEWLGGDGGAATEELSEVLLEGAISISR